MFHPSLQLIVPEFSKLAVIPFQLLSYLQKNQFLVLQYLSLNVIINAMYIQYQTEVILLPIRNLF
jgi:hypothetical protein